MRYIVCDTDELSEQAISERLPAGAEVEDYVDSLGMVGVRFDATDTPETLAALAAASLPGGRFPRFPVVGRGA